MGKTVEPCIHEVPATKRNPAGFRVRKQITDQWGDQRQVSKIFRPVDDSEQARQTALNCARAYVQHLETQKMTGAVYRKFSERLDNERRRVSGYAIPWHEYPEGSHNLIKRDLADQAEWDIRNSDLDDTIATSRTLQAYLEEHKLPWYEEHTSKGNFHKKRAAYHVIKEYVAQKSSPLLEVKLRHLRKSQIQDLISWMPQQLKSDGSPRWAESTLKGYFTTILSFFRDWADDEQAADPTVGIMTTHTTIAPSESPRSKPTAKDFDRVSEGIESAIEHAREHLNGRYLHCRLILRYIHRVMMGTGLRISEVLFLTEDHIDKDRELLTVEGGVVGKEVGLTKRGEMLKSRGISHSRARSEGTRVIPLNSDVKDTIEEWLAIRNQHGYPPPEQCQTIFCQRSGDYLTSRIVRSYYSVACDHAEGDISITPHDVRHYFNDRLRRNGVPAEVRQAILGHEEAETNEIYTDVKASEGREAIENLDL